MTLYFTLVFLVLVSEMAVFMLLVIPLPYTWKRNIFTFISESPLIARLQYGLKITFIGILILFIDSVNRVYRVQVELANVQGAKGAAGMVAGHERMEVQARKFYSQRNMYLCGFTLFLSLILNRTYTMILEQLRLEAKVKRYEGTTDASSKQEQKLDQAGESGEIGRLKREIEKRDKNIEALKRQTDNLQREYGILGDTVTLPKHQQTPKKDK